MTGPVAGSSRSASDYGWFLAIILIACAILPLGWIVKVATSNEHLYPDFFGLWSAGRYVLTHAPATIYDDRALQTFQSALGMPVGQTYPFSYPPWILLVLAPLGALPFPLAEGVWLVLTFAAYVAALDAWRWKRVIVGLLVLAPSSAVCFLVGQNGFLTAALLLGGVRLLRTRPLMAGALLACVGYKPQFAILIPFVLLFRRHWRAAGGAAMTGAGLSVASMLAFGTGTWSAWIASLGAHAAALAGGRVALLDIMPTVNSAALLVNASPTVARLLQGLGVVAGLIIIWRLRDRQDPEAQAALPLAVILAAPYAFYYDLPMVTGGVLAVVAARTAPGQRFGGMAFPALIACVLSPAILIARPGAVSAAVPVIFAMSLLVLCRTPDLPAPPGQAGA